MAGDADAEKQPSHFDATRPPYFVKAMAVPLTAWIPNIVMFFAVNLLNNMAFGYNISVPVHIILRSGGSVLTMLVGFVWGKRYTSMQVFSVIMLTVGIIIAAMADAQAKGKISTASSHLNVDRELFVGLSLLFVAQLLSAVMGLYVQITYAKYGSHWSENLFYSHLLSIPFFLPFGPGLWAQAEKLQSYSSVLSVPTLAEHTSVTLTPTNDPLLPLILTTPLIPRLAISPHILSLGLNALTQYACIRGVNMLAARTSAIGVSIVLNVRKLASLFISIHVFGNQLPVGVMCGAAIVFSSAGLWAWETQRIGKQKKLLEDSKKEQ